MTTMELDPLDFGISAASIDELRTGDSIANAKIIRDILEAKESGPRRHIVILNAAAAIMVGNLTADFDSAIEIANKSVSEGKALLCLEKLIEVSNG
jgi:anthranilate phosphoribosyltransferase